MKYELDGLQTECGKGIFTLFPSLCKGCGLCMEKCPTGTLGWSKDLGLYGTPVVAPGKDGKECTACGMCQMVCPDCAIKIERKKGQVVV